MRAFAPLARHIESLRGRMGVFAMEVDGDELFAREADVEFPAASVIKLPLVMALYAEAAAGRVSLDERVAVGERVGGTGVVHHLADLEALSLRDHAMLACITSDNTTTNRVIERVGIERVNGYLDEWGCPTSRLRRGMFDEEAKRRGVENRMTPRETARLLAMLLRGELVDRATSDAVIDLLHRNDFRGRLLRYVPAAVWTAHKEGNIERVRNDAGIVRVERAVTAAGFCRDLEEEIDGDIALGLLGWCAYRAAGGEGPEVPKAFESSA